MKFHQFFWFFLVIAVCLRIQATTAEECVDLLPNRCEIKYCSYPAGVTQCQKTCNICTPVTPTNSTFNNGSTTTAKLTTTITNTATINSTISTSSVRNSTLSTNSGSHSSKRSVLFVPVMLLWLLYRHLTELGS
ncbi:uncharacterized protein LOC110239819 isoform X2 [Exaiptasia diaphana]|uniref:ShKT domain-containing protein n=1 Tax=Exaiptasia diaphana TaxID=2652724 RepID=A0A913YJC9_EXADI|nr:uncharacterized protein LOC110239819 isoform X2 [Exaiptasia diaphana]